MIDNPDLYPNHPREDIAYVFSHYFGTFITATLIFIVYALGRFNQPYAPSELVLPAFIAGSMWAIAQWSFFVANQHLSQAISFPIITSLPASIASMWGIFYFREIKGTRNMVTFGVALVLSVSGAVLVGLSKEVHL
ncbi:hypothetical protein ANCDUO_10687 [Ancylostoma duodenale]|uniref:EamA domain-containing protein n=1 Tax=Ancylostoma duodenale TaxID=51022 RepID=A0A0C2GQ37_9BILA|nr:hypothetical protein ANCDUO_10687 [Ancylostoma duodenale]